LTKDGNAANDGKHLDPDSVVTLVDTVPVIFVDMNSMEPLSIVQTGRVPVYPDEIGPCCKAWMDNQRAKIMAAKGAMNIFMLIAIVCCIGAIVISVLTMNSVNEMKETLNTILSQLQMAVPNRKPIVFSSLYFC
jgi:nitrate/nitrite transporter NarK